MALAVSAFADSPNVQLQQAKKKVQLKPGAVKQQQHRVIARRISGCVTTENCVDHYLTIQDRGNVRCTARAPGRVTNYDVVFYSARDCQQLRIRPNDKISVFGVVHQPARRGGNLRISPNRDNRGSQVRSVTIVQRAG